ncbi:MULTISPECIES: PRD domain-containing protein [Liquorilactobacillus]|uniref:Beta-glucoside operon antiterminator n=1 Tax=Liquorilactobacillus satsumensis DSM 16230 = JCM 12392 TaxID=1423801 RepID=A0A0R1V4H7_9LACO|nr:PRD domain-containing protein [Liquorilactobacillus satsumensis]KRL98698.1 beta-glucoside operon antiterminator [Liquorilactobacillus satsumensis DSM 16230 = JCM 12392]MCP9328121.1 PRD domain-containing protein [Liquorilactobacillus satsumensis]
MIIKKRLNNNAVLAINENGIDIILAGNGIGFNTKRGQEVDKDKIEKIYKLDTQDNQNKLIQVVTEIPYEYLKFTDSIVRKLKEVLQIELNDNIYIALTDHIYFAVTRFKEGVGSINTSLLWDVKDIYPNEYKEAVKILEKINDFFKVAIPSEEARMLTFHIVDNFKGNYKKIDMGVAIKTITDILNIVKYYFNIEYNVNSFNYVRFVIHLRFLTKRILYGEKEDENTLFFYDQLPQKMPRAFKCTLKITEYIKKTRKVELSKSEQAYLTIHIQRIILNNK